MRSFCSFRRTHVHKIPRFKGGGVFWVLGGGGSADFVMGVGIFLNIVVSASLRDFERQEEVRAAAARVLAIEAQLFRVENSIAQTAFAYEFFP